MDKLMKRLLAAAALVLSLGLGVACEDTIIAGPAGVVDVPLGAEESLIDAEELLDTADSACAGCDGDLTDEHDVWTVTATAGADGTTYTVTINGQDFEFTCESAEGCATAADIEQGLVDAINGRSFYAHAVPGSVVIIGNPSFPLGVTVSDDDTDSLLDAEMDQEGSGGTDVEALSILFSFLTFGPVLLSGSESFPEALTALLPEDPSFGTQVGPFRFRQTLACNNPGGSVSLTLIGTLVYQDMGDGSPFGSGPTWVPSEQEMEALFNNCELQGADGQLGIVGNLPTFKFDGQLLATFGMPLLSFEDGPETFVAVFDVIGDITASDPVENDSPAAGEPVGIWFAPESEGGTPLSLDGEFFVVAGGLSEGIVMDGGLCIGGSVVRNRDGVVDLDSIPLPNDYCALTADPGLFVPVTMLVGFCDLSPQGAPGAWAPLVLAVGLVFFRERRRRRA